MSPARARAARAVRAAADSACRRARWCRCAARPPRRSRGRAPRGAAHRPPARRCSSASAKPASRAEPTSATSVPLAKSRISARVYSRLTVACVPSTVTCLLTERAQAGLMAGTVPTKGTRVARAQMRQHQRRGGVAGDDHEVGTVRRDQVAHQRDHARDQLRLAVAAVGKEGVVGHVDVASVRPRLHHLAKDGEAAEPGIEDENGRCSGHGGCLVRKACGYRNGEMLGGVAVSGHVSLPVGKAWPRR